MIAQALRKLCGKPNQLPKADFNEYAWITPGVLVQAKSSSLFAAGCCGSVLRVEQAQQRVWVVLENEPPSAAVYFYPWELQPKDNQRVKQTL